MSDIDERLTAILNKARTEQKPDARELVPQIKQAFADEGYVHLPNLKAGDYISVNGGTVILNGDGTMTKVVRMTGQEWYDRFEKELDVPLGDAATVNLVDSKTISNAAKRASGLSDESL